jgi:hypothetical protein
LEVERYSVAGSSLDDPQGHGTCAASIAYGKAGIMIQGTLVSIKAFEDNVDNEFPISNFWDAFAYAITDIAGRPERRGRSVININSKSIIYQMTFVHNNLHIII